MLDIAIILLVVVFVAAGQQGGLVIGGRYVPKTELWTRYPRPAFDRLRQAHSSGVAKIAAGRYIPYLRTFFPQSNGTSE